MNETTREIGNVGEIAICRYVSSLGYEVVYRNYTIRGGEIDIVACDNEYLLFIEVKTRRIDYVTSGLQAITKAKRRNIIKTAIQFCNAYEVLKLQPRFDVAEVIVDVNRNVLDLQYYPNAFDANELGIYIPIY